MEELKKSVQYWNDLCKTMAIAIMFGLVGSYTIVFIVFLYITYIK